MSRCAYIFDKVHYVTWASQPYVRFCCTPGTDHYVWSLSKEYLPPDVCRIEAGLYTFEPKRVTCGRCWPKARRDKEKARKTARELRQNLVRIAGNPHHADRSPDWLLVARVQNAQEMGVKIPRSLRSLLR